MQTLWGALIFAGVSFIAFGLACLVSGLARVFRMDARRQLARQVCERLALKIIEGEQFTFEENMAFIGISRCAANNSTSWQDDVNMTGIYVNALARKPAYDKRKLVDKYFSRCLVKTKGQITDIPSLVTLMSDMERATINTIIHQGTYKIPDTGDLASDIVAFMLCYPEG